MLYALAGACCLFGVLLGSAHLAEKIWKVVLLGSRVLYVGCRGMCPEVFLGVRVRESLSAADLSVFGG